MVETITHLATSVEGVSAEDDGFCLSDLIVSLGIKPIKFIYINWYRFDEIDKMEMGDLNRYFDNIWYPSSDDIDIFDDGYLWLLSIRHDGEISIVEFDC